MIYDYQQRLRPSSSYSVLIMQRLEITMEISDWGHGGKFKKRRKTTFIIRCALHPHFQPECKIENVLVVLLARKT